MSNSTVSQLFHITARKLVEQARSSGRYAPPGFADEGFIHCSYLHQVVRVANRRFQGQAGLVLLQIEPARLSAPVVEENLEDGTELFPHLYERLRFDAVSAVYLFPCASAGCFELPTDLLTSAASDFGPAQPAGC